MVIPIIVVLFIFSFILAWRQLKTLNIPNEVKTVIREAKNKKTLWGVIVFLKNRVLYYSSEASPSPDSPGNNSSSTPDSR